MRFAIALLLAVGCGKKDEPAPDPTPAPTPAPQSARPSPLPPPGHSRKRTGPPGDPPDCAAVLAKLDVAAICGAGFPLTVKEGPGAQCALVPAENAPVGQLLRIHVSRTPARRLPARYTADGWHGGRDKTTAARLGRYPWLISIKSRGTDKPVCSGDAIAALAARVGELVPADPSATEAPANPRCEAILTAAQVNQVCGTQIDKLFVGVNEDGDEVFCSRGAVGFGFVVGSQIKPTARDVAGTVGSGPYKVSLSAAGGSRCDRADLEKLLAQTLPRAKKALAAAKK